MKLVRLGSFAALGLGAAIVISAAAFLVGQQDDEMPTATVTLGLTKEVNWPFFEPVRGRLAILADQELEAEVAAQLDSENLEINVSVPDTLAVVEVMVIADTSQDAEAGAELAATMILDAADAARLGSLDDKIVVNQAALEDLQTDIANDEADIDALVERIEASDAAVDGESRLTLDRELDRVTETRNHRLRSALLVETDLVFLNIERDSSAPEVDIVGRTSSSAESSSSSLLPIGIGLFGGVLTAVGAFWFASEHGRIMDRSHLHAAFGLPVLDGPGQRNVGFLRWLRAARDNGTDVVLLDGPQEIPIEIYDTWLQVDSSAASRLPRLLDRKADGQAELMLEADAAVVVTSPKSTIRGLRAQIDELARSGIAVQAFIYTGRQN